MDRETARRNTVELQDTVNKAYDAFERGKITEAKFNQVCDEAEKESERIDVAFKSRARANQFAGSGGPGDLRGGLAGPVEGRRCKGAAPKFAFGEATLRPCSTPPIGGKLPGPTERPVFQLRCRGAVAGRAGAVDHRRAVHEWRILDRIPVQGVTAPSFEIIRHVSTSGAAAIVAEGRPSRRSCSASTTSSCRCSRSPRTAPSRGKPSPTMTALFQLLGHRALPPVFTTRKISSCCTGRGMVSGRGFSPPMTP